MKGAATLEATFQAAMKATTFLKLASRSGARRSSVSGRGGPVRRIGGSGTRSR
jgi:hypothetical protein